MDTTTNVHWNEGDIVEEHDEREEDLCSNEAHIDFYNEQGLSYALTLYKKDLHELYEDEFGAALDEYNAKQTKKSRRMTMDEYMQSVEDDNRGKKQTRKTADGKRVVKEDARQGKQLRYEFNVSVGNTNREKDDDGHVLYDETGHHIRREYLPRELQSRILRRYVDGFQERNPNLILQAAYEHGDEGFFNKKGQWEYSEVHLHMCVVPVAEGFKRGLQKQNSMNKAMAQMGFDTPDCYHQWAEKENDRLNAILHEEYTKYCEEHPDFYAENGDLSIYTPVKDKNRQGGMTKEQYAHQQEFDETVSAFEQYVSRFEEVVKEYNDDVGDMQTRDKKFVEVVSSITGNKYDYDSDTDLDYGRMLNDLREWGLRVVNEHKKREQELNEREQIYDEREALLDERQTQYQLDKDALDAGMKALKNAKKALEKQNEAQLNEERRRLEAEVKAELISEKQHLQEQNEQILADALREQVEDVRSYREWQRMQTLSEDTGYTGADSGYDLDANGLIRR